MNKYTRMWFIKKNHYLNFHRIISIRNKIMNLMKYKIKWSQFKLNNNKEPILRAKMFKIFMPDPKMPK